MKREINPNTIEGYAALCAWLAIGLPVEYNWPKEGPEWRHLEDYVVDKLKARKRTRVRGWAPRMRIQ